MSVNTTVDPVCGSELEELDTAILTCYGGQLLAFCSRRCLEAFSENPEGFLSAVAQVS